MRLPFEDRAYAGRLLGQALAKYANRPDVIVLALPRGGVPVGFEAAQAINASLDIMLVRKLGTPGHEELAMGAIASGGITVFNTELVSRLHIGPELIEAAIKKEQQELERREQAYRGNHPPPVVENRHVILVDDGLATGASMRAAVAALKQRNPASIIVAIPVAPPDTVEVLKEEADEVICLAMPEPFSAVGRWYRDFSQTSDEDVKSLLESVWSTEFSSANYTEKP
ncbi:phosphoribosyltransferase [Methylobacter sp. YRD-M1]|uniref:phosphoribosyltransferase n=1 Tax=Methylobacter sp. YRD-M1 TaxID=2911520 RepID=UPI00227A71A9|nr:phosphoribosyltransferase [Methylobacter sp. YRD-M1]WAK01279.1 phosphoribosyltransferase [Methylobacter sp. YRD-M1]